MTDLGACVNDFLDGDPFSRSEYYELRRILREDGCDSLVRCYVTRLREMESTRPNGFGNRTDFRCVRTYRESVVQLSLAALEAAVTGADVEDAVHFPSDDALLGLVYRIVMLCQVLDDGFDYADDRTRGLPTFLTGHAHLEQSLKGTTLAAHDYGSVGPTNSTLLPFRAALRLLYWSTLSGLFAARVRVRFTSFAHRLCPGVARTP